MEEYAVRMIVTRISRTMETNVSRSTSRVMGSIASRPTAVTCVSYEPPVRDPAHVHLELDVHDRRAAQIPRDAVNGRGTDRAQDRVGEERLDGVRGVDVDRGDVGPVAAEPVEAVAHDAEHVGR